MRPNATGDRGAGREGEIETWLRGPVPGVDRSLQPAAHALLQAREDLTRVVSTLTEADLWKRPGGAAPPGFHVKHAMGSLDRLMTYARGEELSPEQRAAYEREREPGEAASALLTLAQRTIDAALEVVKQTGPEELFEARAIGRARLPSTVLGVLVHAGEHTARHVGQLITTVMVIRG